ncbi:MAG: hypothetical protein ABS36_17915 [Acidobacteria bacterium SCN 69-37]|nr:MAG: hypothetical protein ABS36_17915 [Acidobacteria bacterium SCN 69-37]
MFRAVAVVILVLSSVVPALAQRKPAALPPHPFDGVPMFACTFTRYGLARWEGEAPPTVIAGDDTFRIGITDFDRRRNRARVVGGNGTVDVSAFFTPTGLNVIEQTPGGNFILTTIFVVARSPDSWYAVHARHLGDPEAPPSVSQYYGSCAAAK